jgi:hypothetical protein
VWFSKVGRKREKEVNTSVESFQDYFKLRMKQNDPIKCNLCPKRKDLVDFDSLSEISSMRWLNWKWETMNCHPSRMGRSQRRTNRFDRLKDKKSIFQMSSSDPVTLPRHQKERTHTASQKSQPIKQSLFPLLNLCSVLTRWWRMSCWICTVGVSKEQWQLWLPFFPVERWRTNVKREHQHSTNEWTQIEDHSHADSDIEKRKEKRSTEWE